VEVRMEILKQTLLKLPLHDTLPGNARTQGNTSLSGTAFAVLHFAMAEASIFNPSHCIARLILDKKPIIKSLCRPN
jgi:hypothetical protein